MGGSSPPRSTSCLISAVMKSYFAAGFFYNPESQKILLHHRSDDAPNNPGKWATFGGLSEPGDASPLDTFIREVLEELGVKINPNEVSLLRQGYNEERKIERYIYFVTRDLKDEEIKLGEGQGYAWLTLAQALAKDLTPRVRQDLQFFDHRQGLI